MKVKIKRGDQELEVEESEIQDGDERMETQPNKDEEKRFSQKDLNKFLADERRKMQSKIDALTSDLKSYQDKDAEREEKLKTKVEEARKGYPEAIIKLLDKMPYSEQLEWIETNPVEPKSNLPRTPKGKEDDGIGKSNIDFGNLI